MNKNPAFKPVLAVLAFIVVFLGWALNAQAVSSPSSLSVEILEMRISRNSDCSAAVSVFTASPKAWDMFGGPGLGSGIISTGTYHCVMFHISDTVRFIPKDSLEPLCVPGTTYTYDIYQPVPPNDSVAPDGTHIPATTGDDSPWIYLSDAPTAVTLNNGCFQPTKTLTGGPCVLAPLTILSDQTHTLVMNADSQLGPFGCGTTCCLSSADPVVISIR